MYLVLIRFIILVRFDIANIRNNFHNCKFSVEKNMAKNVKFRINLTVDGKDHLVEATTNSKR